MFFFFSLMLGFCRNGIHIEKYLFHGISLANNILWNIIIFICKITSKILCLMFVNIILILKNNYRLIII